MDPSPEHGHCRTSQPMQTSDLCMHVFGIWYVYAEDLWYVYLISESESVKFNNTRKFFDSRNYYKYVFCNFHLFGCCSSAQWFAITSEQGIQSSNIFWDVGVLLLFRHFSLLCKCNVASSKEIIFTKCIFWCKCMMSTRFGQSLMKEN